MRKIDCLIIRTFTGPFFLTLTVVVFILLVQLMMQYIDDLLGKGLSYAIFSQLLFYFALQLIPLALPLAVLLSSLITFGNMGEHFELTAMKGGGISLIRVLVPAFLFTVLVATGSFWFNDRVVPKTNLKVYSLLWDIKQKSPALHIREGLFYNGLPGYSIKVNKKYEKGELKDIMIYNHSEHKGNRELIVADSGRMYTFHHERYLALELFYGNTYHDHVNHDKGQAAQAFVRTSFDKSQIVFSLASFEMGNTDQNQFISHQVMKGYQRLYADIDTLMHTRTQYRKNNFDIVRHSYPFLFPADSSQNDQPKVIHPQKSKDTFATPVNKTTTSPMNPSEIQTIRRALITTRQLENQTKNCTTQLIKVTRKVNEHFVELYKKFTLAFACITMFCIGAPLGTIIKKGGLGLPVLFSIAFFIVFYMMTITGEKWVKQAYVTPIYGMWGPNAVLLCVGIFFLRQAKNDSRLFEADMYYVYRERIFEKFRKKA